MKLVVDTSIVFSMFKSKSFTRQLLSKYKIELFSPKELIIELYKYSDEVCSKAKISKEKFLEDISLLPQFIEFKNASSDFKNKTGSLISHETDILFLALALELNLPLWSNDLHFKQQSKVKVYTTEELFKILKSKNNLE